MKKILSIALTLVLLMGMLALLPVSAEETYATNTVAVIGTTEYTDLATALQAATDGQTVEVVKDVTYTGNVTTANSYTVGSTASAAYAVITNAITIDGKGHKFTFSPSSTSSNYFAFCLSGKVTVKDYTIIASKASAIQLTTANADVTLDNLTVTSDYLAISSDGNQSQKLTVNGGIYRKTTVSDVFCMKTYGTVVLNHPELYAYRGEVLFAISGAKSTATINGGTYLINKSVNKHGALLRADASAHLTVHGGLFVA